MWIYIKDRPKLLLSLLLGVWVLLTLAASLGANLSGSEAYVWYVAQSLDWSYVDSSPLGVFFAWLGFNIAGGTLFGLRLLFIIAQGFALYLFYDVVCPKGGDSRSVGLYFLIALSIPLLHINGFFALADQLLMLAMVVGFWVCAKFLASPTSWWAVALGGSLALIASIGYQGLLLVLALLFCERKLLRSFGLYIALVVCAVLLAPQIWWQYVHDWPILASHFVQHEGYSFGGAFRGLTLAALRFNPLIVGAFLMITLSRKRDGDTEPMARLMRAMFWVCVAFIIYTSSRGITPSLSVIPMLFPLLFVLVDSTKFRGAYRRYLLLATSFSVALIVGLRLFVVVDTYGAAAGESRARSMVDTLLARGVDVVIFNDSPESASMVDFFDSLPSYSMVSSRGRINEYLLRDYMATYYQKRVAVQLPDYAVDAISWDSLAKYFVCLKLPDDGERSYFHIVDKYVPTGAITIQAAVLPEKVLTASRIAITLTIANPSLYDLALGQKKGQYDLVMQLKAEPSGSFHDIILPLKEQILPSQGQIVIGTTALIPTVNTGLYSVVFTLRHFPEPSPANSPVYTMRIINPKSRI